MTPIPQMLIAAAVAAALVYAGLYFLIAAAIGGTVGIALLP